MNGNTTKNWLISLMLTVVMLLSLVPLTVVPTYAGNSNIQTDVLKNGSLMTDKNTYVITKDTSLKNLKVQDNATVVLYIAEGATLTVTGDNGTDAQYPNINTWKYNKISNLPNINDDFKGYGVAATGGQAAIYLPAGATLILAGGGTLKATGGKGGNGTDAVYYNGVKADINNAYQKAYYYIFPNVGGGKGAAGGGAAIGTHGAKGTETYNLNWYGGFSWQSDNLLDYSFNYQARAAIWSAWSNGYYLDNKSANYVANGSAGANSEDAGTLYNFGVTIADGTSGGAGGNGGKDSPDNSNSPVTGTYTYTPDGKNPKEYTLELFLCKAHPNKGGVAGQNGNGNSTNPLGAGGAGGGNGGNGGNGKVEVYGYTGGGMKRENEKITTILAAGPDGEDGTQGTRGSDGNYYNYTTTVEKLTAAKSDGLKNYLEYEVTLNWLDKATADTSTTKTVKAYFGLDMETLTEVEIPTKKGYTFTGYYSQADGKGTQYYDADGKSTHVYDGTDVAISDCALYAGWEVKDISLNYYDGTTKMDATRILDLDGKTTYTMLNALTLPVRVMKEDHLFVGWYKDAELTVGPISQISVGTVDIENLYAKWQKLEGTKALSEELTIAALRSAPSEEITPVTYATAKVTVKLDGEKADVEQVQLRNGTAIITMGGSEGDYSYTAVNDGSLTGDWQVWVNGQNSDKTVSFAAENPMAVQVDLVTAKITVNNNGTPENGHSVVLKDGTNTMVPGESATAGVYSTVVFVKNANYAVYVDDEDVSKTVNLKNKTTAEQTVEFYTVSVTTKLDGKLHEIGAVELRNDSSVLTLEGSSGEYSLTKLSGADSNSYNLYVNGEKTDDTTYAFTDAGNKTATLEYSTVTVKTKNNNNLTEIGIVTLRDDGGKLIHTLNTSANGCYTLVQPKSNTVYRIFVGSEDTGLTTDFNIHDPETVAYYTARVTTQKDGTASELGAVTLRPQNSSTELAMTALGNGVYELRRLEDTDTVYDVLVSGMAVKTLQFSDGKYTCTANFSATQLTFVRASQNINMGAVVLKGSENDADIPMEYNADGSYTVTTVASGQRTVYLDGVNTGKAVTLGEQNTLNVYSLSYNANGGVGISESNEELYLENENAPISSVTPTKYFHQFVGWSDGNNTYTADTDGSFGSLPMTKDIVLTAQWNSFENYEARVCTDTKDGNSPWQYFTLKEAMELVTAHPEESYIVEVMKNITLLEDLTLPANVELVVRQGVTITGNIVNSGTLTVNGSLSGNITNNKGAGSNIVGTVSGNINNAGTLIFSGVITDMGTEPVSTSAGILNGNVTNSGTVKLYGIIEEMKALNASATNYEKLKILVFGTINGTLTNKQGCNVYGGGVIQSDKTLSGGGTIKNLVNEAGATVDNTNVGVLSNAGVMLNSNIASGTNIGGTLKGAVHADSGVTFAQTASATDATVYLCGGGTVTGFADINNASAFAGLAKLSTDTDCRETAKLSGNVVLATRLNLTAEAVTAFVNFTTPTDLSYNKEGKIASVTDDRFDQLGTITVYYKSGTSDWQTTPPKDAGTYQVKIDVSKNDYFNGISGVENTAWVFSISQRVAVLQWASPSDLVYDGTAKTPTVTVVNTQTGDVCTATSILTEGKDNENAGTFTFTATALGNGNYKLPTNVTSPVYTIEKRKVGLAWASPSNLVYDKTAKVPTVSATNLVNGDTCTVDSAMTKGCDNVNAGTFTFTATALDNGNYVLPTNATSPVYTIEKREVGLTWASPSNLVYDKTAKNPTVSTTNLVEGDVCTVTDLLTPGKDDVNVGKFTYTATALGNSNYKLPVDAVSPMYEILPKTVGLTWTAPENLVYNKTAKVPTASATDLEIGDACAVTGEVTFGMNNVNVGDFTFTATALSNSNYKLPDNAVSPIYTITQKEARLKWASPTSLVYSGNEKIPSVVVDNLETGDTCTVTATTLDNNVDAGDFTFTATALSNSNYKLPAEVSHGWTIARCDQILSSDKVFSVSYTEDHKPVIALYTTDKRSDKSYITYEISADRTATLSDMTLLADAVYYVRKAESHNFNASNWVEFTVPQQAQYTVKTSNSVGGQIKVMNGSEEVKSGSKVYEGTVLTLTSTPNSNYALTGWYASGEKLSGTTYTVRSDVTLKAVFTRTGYDVVAIPTPYNAIYDGNEHMGFVVPVGVTMTDGTLSAINAGRYSVTLRLNAGTVWEDGTSGEKTIVWKIFKAETTAPSPNMIKVSGKTATITAKLTNLNVITPDGTTIDVTRSLLEMEQEGFYSFYYQGDANHYDSARTLVKVAPALEITTEPPTGITDNGATISYKADRTGASESGFILWISANEEDKSTIPSTDLSKKLEGLSPNTSYTYVPYVVKDGNTYYGDKMTFHTASEKKQEGKIDVNIEFPAGVQSGSVSVEQGNTVLASVNLKVTGEKATTQFENLPDGCFNIVLRTENYTETRMIIIQKGSYEKVSFSVPVGSLCTSVQIKNSLTPDVAVKGLPDIIETQELDTDSVARGERDVEICLEVEALPEVNADGVLEIGTTKAGNEMIEAFVDLSLYSTIRSYRFEGGEKTLIGIEKKDIGNENEAILEIAIPYVTDKTIVMYRYHDGEAEKLTALSQRPASNYTDGTYFVDNGYIFLYAKNFSTYAIGYVEHSSSSNSAVISAKTCDMGIALYAGLALNAFLSSGVVVATRKRKVF